VKGLPEIDAARDWPAADAFSGLLFQSEISYLQVATKPFVEPGRGFSRRRMEPENRFSGQKERRCSAEPERRVGFAGVVSYW
jgi:hypothetical protein